MPQHGEYINEGVWQGKRWCKVCDAHHGQVYPCPKYPPELLKEIEKDLSTMKENLGDPEWVSQQLAAGLPPEAIVVAKAFLGL